MSSAFSVSCWVAGNVCSTGQGFLKRRLLILDPCFAHTLRHRRRDAENVRTVRTIPEGQPDSGHGIRYAKGLFHLLDLLRRNAVGFCSGTPSPYGRHDLVYDGVGL